MKGQPSKYVGSYGVKFIGQKKAILALFQQIKSHTTHV